MKWIATALIGISLVMAAAVTANQSLVLAGFHPANAGSDQENTDQKTDAENALRYRQMAKESRIMRRVLTKALQERLQRSQPKGRATSQPSSRPAPKPISGGSAPQDLYNEAILDAGAQITSGVFGNIRSQTQTGFSVSSGDSQVIPHYGTTVTIRLRIPRRVSVAPKPAEKDLWEESSAELSSNNWFGRNAKKRWDFDGDRLEKNINTILDALARHAKHLKAYRPEDYYAVNLELRSTNRDGTLSVSGNRIVIQVLISDCLAASRGHLGAAAMSIRNCQATRIDRF